MTGQFRYRAVDPRGAVLTGVLPGDTSDDVERRLVARGLAVVHVRRARVRANAFGKRLVRRDLITFTRNVAVLYRSGVPITEGLDDMARDPKSPELARLARELIVHLEAGASLSEALARYPRVFARMYLAGVRAGEMTGALDSVLTRLAEHLEWRASIRGMLLQAFLYPAILVVLLLGLVTLLLTFLIPNIVQVFTRARVSLPAPTRLVMALSAFLVRYGWILLAAGLLALALLAAALRTRRGRIVIHAALLRLPLLGDIVVKAASAQFAATLRTLHHAGAPMSEALRIAADSVGNAAMAATMHAATARVEQGQSLSEALRESRHVQPLVARMVSVGEKSGQLEEALGHVVQFFDAEVPQSVKRFVSLLEPTMTIVSGLVVGFVVSCSVLPIFRLIKALKQS
ncbi:MAG: type II secretion system F family protein [Planctomycetota bacterium]